MDKSLYASHLEVARKKPCLVDHEFFEMIKIISGKKKNRSFFNPQVSRVFISLKIALAQ